MMFIEKMLRAVLAVVCVVDDLFELGAMPYAVFVARSYLVAKCLLGVLGDVSGYLRVARATGCWLTPTFCSGRIIDKARGQ